VKLGVNVDHIATLRQVRQIDDPDPVEAMKICEKAGCDSIVCHLREDRRHIQDKDVFRLKKEITTKFNLEMCIAKKIVDIACVVCPEMVTLVPEKRQELTTEGGLDILSQKNEIKDVITRLSEKNIQVSLFIDPEKKIIEASKEIGAKIIEIHTGEYANALTREEKNYQLQRISSSVDLAITLGLEVNAGHGLNYENVNEIAEFSQINELNIGHSIIAYAIFYGLENAVKKMKSLIS
jgi:pyridoxine 5-phosphate synthase